MVVVPECAHIGWMQYVIVDVQIYKRLIGPLAFELKETACGTVVVIQTCWI